MADHYDLLLNALAVRNVARYTAPLFDELVKVSGRVQQHVLDHHAIEMLKIPDRAQLGVNALVRFERHGPKVLLIQENTDHRALTGSEALRRSVAYSATRYCHSVYENPGPDLKSCDPLGSCGFESRSEHL